MTYNITQITDKSDRSAALTNPVTSRDAVLVFPYIVYRSENPPEVNAISGNPTYAEAAATALNIYTKTDNYCFWDNTNSAVQWVGQNGGTGSYNIGAGDLNLIINPDGSISFDSDSR